MRFEDFIDGRLTDTRRPTFAWDDWDSNDHWMWDPPDGFLNDLSDAAKVALLLGSGAWSVRRFAALDADPLPSQILQAGWAFIGNPDAATYYETNWDDWLGPVRGPLGLVCDITMDALFARDANPDLGIRTFWMANLTRYVLGDDAKAFDEWFAWAHAQLAQVHPRSEMPPPDLFDPFPALHPIVGRSALDPASAYDPAQARQELLHYLFQGARDNPFITYEELRP
jgi:hypothetical protein